jgi:hypothetical protein
MDVGIARTDHHPIVMVEQQIAVETVAPRSKRYTISRGAAACVLKIRFGISLLSRRIQIDFGGNNGKLD